jgi:hypothetical protein
MKRFAFTFIDRARFYRLALCALGLPGHPRRTRGHRAILLKEHARALRQARKAERLPLPA